jgi:glycosyltransferase involved in cell wall biosynthesis
MPNGFPPPTWPVKTYINVPCKEENSESRNYMFSGVKGKSSFYFNKIARRIGLAPVAAPDIWLANIIKTWRPDIIHVIGLFDDQGGLLYLQTRKKFKLEGYGHFVLQLRGGCDMALRRHQPEHVAIIQQALTECEQIICDNRANIQYAGALGIPANKFSAIVPVPGSGGIELGPLSSAVTLPSQRERMILWPKAYECQWSKALPVLEAIQTVWSKVKPFEIHMLAVTPDVYEWFLSMPEEIRRHCHVSRRIPQQEFFSLLKRARIMLAPSLIDGVPNTLYEAMAFGALPIVSPLETITPVVKQGENVLFARNLYPDEIAAALVRAMTDDALVDRAAQNNARLVEKVANRQTIRKQVVDFYGRLLEK